MGRTTVEPRLLAQKPRFQLFTTYSGKSNSFLFPLGVQFELAGFYYRKGSFCSVRCTLALNFSRSSKIAASGSTALSSVVPITDTTVITGISFFSFSCKILTRSEKRQHVQGEIHSNAISKF